MRRLLSTTALIASLSFAASAAIAAPTLFTIAGTGTGTLAGTSFTNSSYVLSYITSDRSNTPTATFFQVGSGPQLTLNITTAFGTGFTTFYLQNLSSRFKNDFFDFTLPDPNIDIYAPFPAVSGTGVSALGGFNNISTSGGALTLSSSSDVIFQGAAATTAAVPEPPGWAMMILGAGAVCLVGRRRRDGAAGLSSAA